MRKTLGLIALGLVSGASLAYVSSDKLRPSQASNADPGSQLAEIEQLNARVVSLEAKLAELSRPAVVTEEKPLAADNTEPVAETIPQVPAEAALRREVRRDRSVESRNERLREAGFDDISIQRIREIESKVQFDAMEARWERQRQELLEGEQSARYQARLENRRLLQEELGEAGYERYLAASRGGRDPSVRVRFVMATSPAAQAGFQRGDQIQSYGGYRTYDNLDLQYASIQGARNEPVIVEILRDGQPMTLTIPRGPLGISN